eukprot:scaffold256887_cov31-Tisochrysis_lutea.AAC.3
MLVLLLLEAGPNRQSLRELRLLAPNELHRLLRVCGERFAHDALRRLARSIVGLIIEGQQEAYRVLDVDARCGAKAVADDQAVQKLKSAASGGRHFVIREWSNRMGAHSHSASILRRGQGHDGTR